MLISYMYRPDEPQDDEGDLKSRSPAGLDKAVPETKTFSLYTVAHLGTIVPRDEAVPMSLDS